MALAVAPPRGRLFQEDMTPFWMLVACSLVNLTTWEQAEPAWLWLRRTYRTVAALSRADPAELHDALRPLGLWRRRSERLPALARTWLVRMPETADDVRRLPGCGGYASDSWAIFVEGRTDVDPTDGKLTWHLMKLREET